jgi:hypothetical protein
MNRSTALGSAIVLREDSAGLHACAYLQAGEFPIVLTE